MFFVLFSFLFFPQYNSDFITLTLYSNLSKKMVILPAVFYCSGLFYISCFVLFCFGLCVCVCVLPLWTKNCLLKIWEELLWNSNGDFIKSIDYFWWNKKHFTIAIPFIHEIERSFQLLLSSPNFLITSSIYHKRCLLFRLELTQDILYYLILF